MNRLRRHGPTGTVLAMTAPGNLDRKVRQLDNDIEAIYGMLTSIEITQKRHHTRLSSIEELLGEHSDTLAGHTATLAGHTATLAEHTGTLAEHGTKLDRIIALLEAR